jgi:hypothetical protein
MRVIEQFDTPEEIYNNPKTEFVARFIGFENFFELTPTEDWNYKAVDGTVFISNRQWEPGKHTGTIRPDDIEIAANTKQNTNNTLSGIIKVRTFLGKSYQYEVETPIGITHNKADDVVYRWRRDYLIHAISQTNHSLKHLRKGEQNEKLGLVSLALVTASILAACGGGNGDGDKGASKEEQTLIISTFGLEEDKMQEDVFKPFEEKYNVDIVLETGTSSERLTKLKSNPNSTVDVIELSQSNAADGVTVGLFEKIDNSKVPNMDNLIDSAKDLAADGSGPAYTLNSIGIVYKRRVKLRNGISMGTFLKGKSPFLTLLPHLVMILYVASVIKG